MSDEALRRLERQATIGGHKDRMKLAEARRRFTSLGDSFHGVCENCGEHRLLTIEPPRTAYADDSKNVTCSLCEPCAKEYHEYWDAMWESYYDAR